MPTFLVRNALVMTHICSTRDRQILELDSMTSRKEYKIEFLKTSRRVSLFCFNKFKNIRISI